MGGRGHVIGGFETFVSDSGGLMSGYPLRQGPGYVSMLPGIAGVTRKVFVSLTRGKLVALLLGGRNNPYVVNLSFPSGCIWSMYETRSRWVAHPTSSFEVDFFLSVGHQGRPRTSEWIVFWGKTVSPAWRRKNTSRHPVGYNSSLRAITANTG